MEDKFEAIDALIETFETMGKKTAVTLGDGSLIGNETLKNQFLFKKQSPRSNQFSQGMGGFPVVSNGRGEEVVD